jgi:hypothetical protein
MKERRGEERRMRGMIYCNDRVSRRKRGERTEDTKRRGEERSRRERREETERRGGGGGGADGGGSGREREWRERREKQRRRRDKKATLFLFFFPVFLPSVLLHHDCFLFHPWLCRSLDLFSFPLFSRGVIALGLLLFFLFFGGCRGASFEY